MRTITIGIIMASSALGQYAARTTGDLGNVADLNSKPAMRTGTSTPAACTEGKDLYWDTSAKKFKICHTANTFVEVPTLGADGSLSIGATVLWAKCSGTTDRTTDLNAQLAALYAAGGGTLMISGVCRVDGAIVMPNDGASPHPTQPSIRITGSGGSTNGNWNALPAPASGLDLRYDAPAALAKIVTLGAGLLEIDHLSLIDGGSDCASFIFTTNTTLSIHNNTFSGSASGASACNDGIVLGGMVAKINGDTDAGFQGFQTVIRENFFDAIRIGVRFQTYSNANVVRDNAFSTRSGNPAGGAIDMLADASTISGNLIEGNLIEVANYKYGVYLRGGSGSVANQLIANSCWDHGVATLACVRLNSGCVRNLVIEGDKDATLTYTVDGNAAIENRVLSAVGPITEDIANQRVGVSTNTPQRKLDVNGDSQFNGATLVLNGFTFYLRNAANDSSVGIRNSGGAGASLFNMPIAALPTYADNAAAVTGGLAAGDFYRTSTGALMVRY